MIQSDISEALTQLLRNLVILQNPDGSFSSENLSTGEVLTTSYFTSVVLLSLARTSDEIKNLPEFQDIIKSAITFLKQSQSLNGSWNYLARNNSELEAPARYPDDLDDTFLALHVLAIWEPDFITPEILASATNILIAAEQSPGGPYFTWIVPSELRNKWGDVDVVVNSNINNFLKYQGITLEPLQQYLKNAVTKNTINDSVIRHSLYYTNELVAHYFMSTELLSEIQISKTENNNSLPLISLENEHLTRTALVIIRSLKTSRGDLDDSVIKKYTERIIAPLTKDTPCKPYPFFVEKIASESREYAGSRALDCALHMEALSMIHQKVSPEKVPTQRNESYLSEHAYSASDSIQRIRETIEIHTYSFPETYSFFVKRFDALMNSPERAHALFPLEYYLSLESSVKQRINRETFTQICTAHVLGIITFTLQDAICDDESPQEHIALVSSGMLLIHKLFESVLYGNSDMQLVNEILHTMNESLLRETITSSLLYSTEGIILMKDIPDHLPMDSLRTVSNKSIGYAISPIVFLILCGGPKSYREIRLMRTYCEIFLGLRQTLDDLHDWYQDLLSQVSNPISSMVLSAYKKERVGEISIDPTKQKYELSTIFWNTVFPQVRTLMKNEISSAKHTISEMQLLSSTDFLSRMITRYEKVLDETTATKKSVSNFLFHYENSIHEKTTVSGGA